MNQGKFMWSWSRYRPRHGAISSGPSSGGVIRQNNYPDGGGGGGLRWRVVNNGASLWVNELAPPTTLLFIAPRRPTSWISSVTVPDWERCFYCPTFYASLISDFEFEVYESDGFVLLCGVIAMGVIKSGGVGGLHQTVLISFYKFIKWRYFTTSLWKFMSLLMSRQSLYCH
jgi:hypothetical protein